MDRYKNSRRMIISVMTFVGVISSVALYMLGKDAAIILTTTLPAMILSPTAWAKFVNDAELAWAKIANDAETKEPK